MTLSREEFDQIRQEAEAEASLSKKRRESEKIARRTREFLANGGEITPVPYGVSGGQQWAGYNRELLNQQVDTKEVAAMLGATEFAIKTATRYGKLWGLKFPTPLPQKTADGRTMFKLPEVVKFRERTRKAVENGRAA